MEAFIQNGPPPLTISLGSGTEEGCVSFARRVQANEGWTTAASGPRRLATTVMHTLMRQAPWAIITLSIVYVYTGSICCLSVCPSVCPSVCLSVCMCATVCVSAEGGWRARAYVQIYR